MALAASILGQYSCLAVTGAGAVAIRSTCPYGITNFVNAVGVRYGTEYIHIPMFQRHNHMQRQINTPS